MTYHNQYEGKVNSPPRLSGTPEQMIKQVSDYVFDQLQALARQSKDEFNAIKDATGTTIISRSGGVNFSGGSSSSNKQSIHIEQGVTGSGTVTVNFISVGTTSYGVLAYVLTSANNFSLAYPLVPPRADTRSMTSVQIDYQEEGTLHVFIILN